MSVRIAAFANFNETDGFLRFLKQYGVDDVVIAGWRHGKYPPKFSLEAGGGRGSYWEFLELVKLRKRFEDAGFRVVGIENPLLPWGYDKIMLGQAGRDQQIENVIATIRNMGRAGIPFYGYHWMVNPVGTPWASWRTSRTTPGRGGSQVASFDMAIAERAPLSRDRSYSVEEMWANYAYFIRAVIPVAEEAGVKLALHPDDPPVEQLGGIPRLFHGVEDFERAMLIADSPASGLNFCLGNWTAMGTDILAAIRRFGSRGQILYGHAQGVRGTVPRFAECFLDEADCDFSEVIRALNAIGFDGVLCPAHFPRTVDETDHQHHGHAYAIGYLRGLIQDAERYQSSASS